MSAHKGRQPLASEVEQPIRSEHPSDQPLRDSDLMRRIGIGHSAFYKRKVKGEFEFLELRPQLSGSNTLYSAHLVAKWLRGELRQPERFFGRATPVVRPKGRPGRPRKSELARFAVIQAAAPPASEPAVQEPTERTAEPTGEAGEFAIGRGR